MREALRSRPVLCAAAVLTVSLSFAGPGGNMTLSQRKPAVPVRPLPASFTAAIDQEAGQADPTTSEPVVFDVEFGQPIDPATFLASDIVQNGSASVTTWTVVNSGDDRHFTIEASGLTNGTVIPTLAADAVDDGAGSTNIASGGADNSVTFAVPACATGVYLYAAGWSPPEINIYCIQASGLLAYLDTVAAPADVRDMQPSADGNNLFYAHGGLTRYTVSADGSLFEAGTVPVGSGTFDDLTLDPSDPGGQFLYGTHTKNFGGVYVFNTHVATPAPALVQTVTTGLYFPRGIAIRPSGSHLHVANYSPAEVYTYPLNASGTINSGGLVKTTFEARPNYLAIPPGLARLYWTEVPGGSVLTGGVSGANVTLLDSIFSGYGARALTLNDAGTALYVANNNTDDIGVFEADGSGELSFLELQPTARRPEHLILHPSGDFLYVASAGNIGGTSTLSIYAVAADGTLTDLLAPHSTPQGMYRLTIIDRSP